MEEHDAVCWKILSSKTHFEVFSLPDAEVEVSEVRKRYRRIALVTHPDKNPSAKATDAFRRLSEAFDCLRDPGAQKVYLQDVCVGGQSCGRPRRKSGTSATKRRRSDDLPCGTKKDREKWWEKRTWEEIERELQKQERSFKQKLREGWESYEKRKKARMEVVKRSEDRVRASLASIASKYGITKEDERSNQEAAVCWLCRRKFRDRSHLDYHRLHSALHRANLGRP